jgi:hypothetical protein
MQNSYAKCTSSLHDRKLLITMMTIYEHHSGYGQIIKKLHLARNLQSFKILAHHILTKKFKNQKIYIYIYTY